MEDSPSKRTSKRTSKRVEGIDVARGVAGLIMIQGHAYHGWVAPAHHGEAYGFTRLLGTFPLPSFLVLAGAAVAWRLEAARARNECGRTVRHGLLRRGLQVLLYGYLVSFGYAIIDGVDAWQTLFRADVLHVIGLSIVAAGLLVGRKIHIARFTLRVLFVGALITLACPWLSRLSPPNAVSGIVTGLFVDAPPFTRMPFVPLFAWFALGVLAAALMLRFRGDDAFSKRAGTRWQVLVALFSLGMVMLFAGEWGTRAMAGNDVLSRSHPAVWMNVLDLAGRGWVVLALGASLSMVLCATPRRALVRLGRGSLVAYIVHVPFCYGLLGGSLVHRSTMDQASWALVPLVGLSWAAVYAWDAFKGQIRRRIGSRRSPLAVSPRNATP